MTYEGFIEKYAKNMNIVQLRHQKNTYKEIGHVLNISPTRARQRYYDFCYKLYKCYRIYLEHLQMEINTHDILEFYKSITIAIAYLEKTYKEPLDLFRHGEPPIMFGYHKKFPNYRKITDIQLLNFEKKILEAKRNKHKRDIDIARELKLTKEKVKDISDLYYHKKVLKTFDIIQPTVNFCFSDYVYKYSDSPEKRWKLILEEYADLIQDLIDE